MAKRPIQIPARSEIADDTPLRLDAAAAIAFPGGGMTASGLRRERDAGRLTTELIAGKEFTTLADIARMRELCRRTVGPKADCLRPPSDDPDEAARASAAVLLRINRIKAEVDAKRKAEREAHRKEREAARALASGRPRPASPSGNPPMR